MPKCVSPGDIETELQDPRSGDGVEPDSDAAMGDAEPMVTPRLRILICEDEGLTLLRLRRSLQALGHVVVGEARNGEEAVRLAQSVRPELIFMDVNMPRMDGVQALQQIMKGCPAPVIMLTAYRDEGTVRRALDMGAAGYLVKPVQEDQLPPAILTARLRFEEIRRHQATARELETARQERVATGEAEQALLREAEQAMHASEERARALQEQIQQEREAARILADGFVSGPPAVSGLQVAYCYEPASDTICIGGDFLDFAILGPRRLAIAMGDLCGHGLEAARHVARAKHMLRAYAAEDPTPVSVVTRLNRVLNQFMEEECPFLTLFYGVLDLDTWELVYCNAAHPAPVLCDPTQPEPISLDVTGGYVGVFESVEYTQSSVTLRPESVLAVFTDGLVEARARGRMLEESGVAEIVHRLASDSAEAIATALRNGACAFAEGRLSDDLAIAVLKRGREPAGSFVASEPRRP